MSVHAKSNVLAYFAGGAIAKGQAVKFGADNKHVVAATAATDKSIGVAKEAAAEAEDKIEVALPGGGGKGLAHGTIAAGDLVTADSVGLITTTTTADRHVAVAMEAAVAGDLFSLHVVVGTV